MFCTVKENGSICFNREEGFRLFTGLEELGTYCWATRNCLKFNFLVCACEFFFFYAKKYIKIPRFKRCESLRTSWRKHCVLFLQHPWPMTFTCRRQVFMSSSKVLWTKKIDFTRFTWTWPSAPGSLLHFAFCLLSLNSLPAPPSLWVFFYFGPSPFYLFSHHTVFVFIHQLVNTSFNGGEAAFFFFLLPMSPFFKSPFDCLKTCLNSEGPAREGTGRSFLSALRALWPFAFFFFPPRSHSFSLIHYITGLFLTAELSFRLSIAAVLTCCWWIDIKGFI